MTWFHFLNQNRSGKSKVKFSPKTEQNKTKTGPVNVDFSLKYTQGFKDWTQAEGLAYTR